MPFVVISPTQTDAKSPVDDLLMDTIREDLDYLLTAIAGSNAQPFDFRVDGNLMELAYSEHSAQTVRRDSNAPLGGLSIAHRLDGTLIARTQTLTASKLYLERGARGGSLICDLRKYRQVNHGIQRIDPKFTDAMSGTASRLLTGVPTQSVTRATPVINTQSIALWKPSLNVQSIYRIYPGDRAAYRQINLDSAPDSDWKIGDRITLSGTTTEDGTYQIVEVNRDGGFNVVIAGELVGGPFSDQTTPAGTCDLLAWAYTYSNPVDSAFTVGDRVAMAGHTSGGNNFTGVSVSNPSIYAINQGGNNIIVKNQNGVAQAGAAGTASCLRWIYAYTAATDTVNFQVGKFANFSGHTSGNNNGTRLVLAIDVAGFNVTVFNASGVTQAGIAGSLNSCYFVLPTVADLSASVAVGDWLRFGSNTLLQIFDVNVLSGLNLVIYGGSTDYTANSNNLEATKIVLKLDADYSTIYSSASRIEVVDTIGFSSVSIDGIFNVTEVNFGGGANYNVVIETNGFTGLLTSSMPYPAGRIITESRSVYSVKPRIDFPTISVITQPPLINLAVTGTFNSEAVLADNDTLGLCVDQLPTACDFDPPSGLVLQVG